MNTSSKIVDLLALAVLTALALAAPSAQAAASAPMDEDVEPICELLIATATIDYLDEPRPGITIQEFVWAQIPTNGCERPETPEELTDTQLYNPYVGYYISGYGSPAIEQENVAPRSIASMPAPETRSAKTAPGVKALP